MSKQKMIGWLMVGLLCTIGFITAANYTIKGCRAGYNYLFSWPEWDAPMAEITVKKVFTNAVNKNITEVYASGTIREITAYNAGDPRQTDSSPCIAADNTNICERLKTGEKICAANFVPLGAKLHIDKYGDCVVADRMSADHPNGVDIAMNKNEQARAKKFGVQKLQVGIKY